MALAACLLLLLGLCLARAQVSLPVTDPPVPVVSPSPVAGPVCPAANKACKAAFSVIAAVAGDQKVGVGRRGPPEGAQGAASGAPPPARR